MSEAREAVLSSVRRALAGSLVPAAALREYRRAGGLDPEGRVELLCRRISDYRAEVRRVAPGELTGAISAAFASRSAGRIGVPPGLPVEWRPEGLEVIEDAGLAPGELDALDGVVTGCTIAIAETGTLVLAGGPSEGRRALSLVPDLHVCVVAEDQVVELVPEALEALEGLVRDERRPLTLVSGPSATSDIELNRVEGVHGPRTLVVLVTPGGQP
jgi:L-lactate dehydrogenase complex protein LldG